MPYHMFYLVILKNKSIVKNVQKIYNTKTRNSIRNGEKYTMYRKNLG